MSIDDDYHYSMDAALSEYNDQIAEEAIKEFKYELLQNYLIKTAALISKPLDMLHESARLIDDSPTASFLFASISSEICVKKLLLEPMVHGLINQEYAASLVAELVIGRNAIDRFSKLFIKLLATEGDVDLLSFKRDGAAIPIWDELKQILKKRNDIAHSADIASAQEAAHALIVARVLLEDIFPHVLEKFYLCIHEGKIIYKSHLPLELLRSQRKPLTPQPPAERAAPEVPKPQE